ncbi:MAG: hypothetical protein Q8Q14_14070 [Gemmatimonadales bacterium]|nr:hypothetical protein [Gemmatimonadales bacterium]
MLTMTRHRWIWVGLVGALALCAFSGCQFVAGLFRWAAGVAESPEAEATASGIAQSLGVGPLWGWLSAFATSATALVFGKKAYTNGRLVSALTGGLEEAKKDRTPEEAAVLQLAFKLIQASATKLGVDATLDAALAARGHNVTPVLREIVAGTGDGTNGTATPAAPGEE